MNHFTKRQVIALSVLSVGFGALFSPPLKSVAQPPESKPEASTAQTSATPQPAFTSASAAGTVTANAVTTITGQGTTGYISKFTGSNVIGNSLLYENAGKIGLGTTAPLSLFSVTGVGNNSYVIFGYNTGTGNAVLGRSLTGIGVHGWHSNAGTAPGVQGETGSTSDNATGVLGLVTSTAPGSGSAAVRGTNNGTGYSGYGIYGSHAGSGTGVYGISPSGYGVLGKSTNNTGVQGISTSSNGVYGISTKGTGVYGYSDSGTGTYGYSLNDNGVYGQSYYGNGVYGASTNGYAGYFKGNVMITGNLAKASGSFKIDHPQHPATEYLSHSFVESPDMMNVYNGNVTTNAKGEAVVTLPTYFQSLNRDFRYQLTPIGQFAQAIVGQEIKGNHFLVRTDKPNVKVSWQVTGIRNDAYAREHRIRVEENKTGADRGKYLYPAGFNAGPDKQIGSSTPRLAKR